jgi:O-antigen/teichoic acid export membrane protein
MNFFNRIFKHELISGTFYIFIGSIFGNFLAFLLNLFLARSLTYADYAIFASLLSVVTLAAIPAGSLNTIIVKFATNYFVKGESGKLKNLYLLFLKLNLGLSVFIIVLFTIFSITISNFLKIDSFWYVIVAGLTISSFYIYALNTAFLQSLLKFRFISFLSAFGGIVKIFFGIAFVILGLRAFSGLWSIFFMTFGMFLVALFPLKNIIFAKSSGEKIDLNLNKILAYSIPTFITVLFMTSFTSMDVILVKHFFNSHLAGFYAGLSLVGKVIFYFTAPIPIVMFPLLVKRHTTGRGFINMFYLALILVMLPSVAISMFYFLFPVFVVKIFLGGRDYIAIVPYLGLFGIYLTIFSMDNVCVNFFLSLGKIKIAYPVVTAALLQIIFIFIFHSNFYQVIGVSLIISFVLLIILIMTFFKMYGNVNKIRETVAFLNTPGV